VMATLMIQVQFFFEVFIPKVGHVTIVLVCRLCSVFRISL
jgi:hypothetical protein